MTEEINASPAASNRESHESQGQKPAPKPSTVNILLKYWYSIVILLLILAVAGTYLWKNLAVDKAKADVTHRAEQIIGEQNETFLRLVAIPLVWAIRSEMIRDNYDQVNQYLTQFIKEKNMKELVVARPDGTVVAATNKKLEGAAITDSFPAEVLHAEKTTVSTLENGEIMVVAPVMGLSKKMGILVLVYMPDAVSLTGMKKPVIFTDLDGTLLDHGTYSFEPALPALSLTGERDIPVVICSSKTRGEN